LGKKTKNPLGGEKGEGSPSLLACLLFAQEKSHDLSNAKGRERRKKKKGGGGTLFFFANGSLGTRSKEKKSGKNTLRRGGEGGGTVLFPLGKNAKPKEKRANCHPESLRNIKKKKKKKQKNQQSSLDVPGFAFLCEMGKKGKKT